MNYIKHSYDHRNGLYPFHGMDYTYLVNAIAKAYRVLNETEDKDVFILNSQNINVLENELLERNKKYYKEMFEEE